MDAQQTNRAKTDIVVHFCGIPITADLEAVERLAAGLKLRTRFGMFDLDSLPNEFCTQMSDVTPTILTWLLWKYPKMMYAWDLKTKNMVVSLDPERR